MGRADLKAKIRLEGDSKGAVKAIAKTEGRFKRLGKTIKTSALAQVAAVAGVVLALRGLVRGIGAVIAAANKQEDAINALEGALAPLGDGVDKVSKALQRQAAELQKTTRFGDETIIQAQALIASFIKEEDQIKAATIATIDLAEAKGFSLVSAADLVSKTLGSSTNALTRYGIEVKGAVGSTERLSSLTENVAKQFGGRAAKATETFSVKVGQLGNAWGDLLEKTGEAITENEGAKDSIDNLTKSVAEAGPGVGELAVGMIELADGAISVLKSMGAAVRGIRLFAEGTIALDGSVRGGEVSMKAMQITATRLGITVQELATRMEQAKVRSFQLGVSMKEAADGLSNAEKSALAAAEAIALLESEAKETATAMEKLGASLNQVTSAELSVEILEIEANLEAVRVTTGGIGPEFERLQNIATREIATIENRIEGLRDGLGDLGEAVDDTGESFDDLSGSVEGTNAALSRQASQARVTAIELRALAAVNESLALAEARTALRITQDERSRVGRTIGGSSGGGTQQRGSYTGLPVGNVGTFIVQPDGTLRPA